MHRWALHSRFTRCPKPAADRSCGDKEKPMNKGRSSYVAQAGMIAAVYAAATLVALLLLQGLAWGPVQFRISEAVCVLAVLTPAAVPGWAASWRTSLRWP